MSQSGVFLCPSCQAVIQSDRGVENGLTCTECGHEFSKRAAMPPPVRSSSAAKKSEKVVRNVVGKKISISVDELEDKTQTIDQPLVLKAEIPKAIKVEEPEGVSGEIPEDRDEVLLPDGSRRVRRRKKKLKKEKQKGLVIFLLVWITIIGGVFYLFKSGDDPEKVVDEEEAEVDFIPTRDRLFINEHFPKVFYSFKAFLNQLESRKQLQFIDQSARLSLPYSRFYRAAEFPAPQGEIFPVDRNVIEIKSEPNLILGLETVWKDEEGNFLESVHVHDGEGWKLDWEAFAPFSTSPWALFNSQTGRSEGTFRVYLRKMKSLDDSERMFVKFYPPPSFKKTEKRGPRKGESPEVEIKTRSDLGQKFVEYWRKYQEGGHLLDSMLPTRDPEGYMRVTAKLSWELDEKDRPIMVLEDILSPSWYGQRIVDAQSENESTDSEVENATEGVSENGGSQKKEEGASN